MKRVRFGIVGTNIISNQFIEGASLDNRFELAAVYSRKEETGKQFASKHNIPNVYTSIEDLAESEEVDAVYIASPNYIHAHHAITCMNRGKHVLCEKPMASNASEVGKMIAAARRNNVLLMEGMLPTLSPNFRVIKENLHRVGTIRRFFASYCQYSSRYDNLKRGIIANAFKPELSNGSSMDIGVYCIYPMVTLFGKPNQVYASVMKLPTGADGQGTLVANYDTFDAVLMYSKIADSMLPTEIQGEEGTIIIDRINCPRKVVFKPHDKSLPEENLTAESGYNPFHHEISEFINLIEMGKIESDINSHLNSLQSISVIDEIRRQSNMVYPADSE